ncbi:hypothetical protein V8D89_009177 [Ganoderma adspersum]
MFHSRPSRTSRRDTVQLPSGATLEYTLIEPRPSSPRPASTEDQQPEKKLAICLHPWSWLGGRMNDPVLQLLTEPLLENGYTVLRYNSRGVGKSTGWASFTGYREGEDLKELVLWARSTMGNVTSLVIAGYSYGSLTASLHPALEDVKTSHILLSYPMGPRHWLTAFHGHRYTTALKSLVDDPGSNVLVIYGDDDNFTTAESYDSWVTSLRKVPADRPDASTEGKLEVVKVAGASHFWREEDAVETLVEAVCEWLP